MVGFVSVYEILVSPVQNFKLALEGSYKIALDD